MAPSYGSGSRPLPRQVVLAVGEHHLHALGLIRAGRVVTLLVHPD